MVIVCSLEVVKFEFHAAEKRGAWHADKAPLVQRLFQAERCGLGRLRHESACLRGQQRGAKDSAVAWHNLFAQQFCVYDGSFVSKKVVEAVSSKKTIR